MINDAFKHRVIYKPTMVIDIHQWDKSLRDFEGICTNVQCIYMYMARCDMRLMFYTSKVFREHTMTLCRRIKTGPRRESPTRPFLSLNDRLLRVQMVAFCISVDCYYCRSKYVSFPSSPRKGNRIGNRRWR